MERQKGGEFMGENKPIYKKDGNTTKRGDRLLQEIDGATGEVTRVEVMRWDEQFFIRKGVNNISYSGYYYDKNYVKAFHIDRIVQFFRLHPELYFYARVMAEWLKEDTGILWRVGESYKWKHLGQDLNFDHTTLYKIRRKLVDYGVCAEIKYFGEKCICMNPFIFGKGDRCLKAVAEAFKLKRVEVRQKNDRELRKKR